MAKLIGTAGHVDHGKTALIQALTGIDADRLPEEKERGMTIDVGFAHIDLPEHGRVSIVDVPGHQRFLTNMLVGALGIDVALLCVAADASVMPQTREHLQILDLLPVEALVVAMTRSDLADPDMRSLAADDTKALVAATRFGEVPVVFVSAVTGEGLDDLRRELDAALATTRPAPVDRPWYLPIDRAFNVKGHGCVVTGTLAQGQVKVGDRAVLTPGDLELRVRAIQIHGEPVESSEAGRRTALNLGGVKLEDVERGMALGEPGAVFETRAIDARVRWVGPHRHGQRVRVSIGAEEAIAKMFLNDHDRELAQLRLDTPVAAAMGQPLILRRYSPPDLVGGGLVAVPQAVARRKKETVAVADLGGTAEEAILAALGDEPNGVPTEEVCRRLGKTPQALGDEFERLSAEGKAFGFAGLWFSVAGWELGSSTFLEALSALHDEKPSLAFLPREQVVHRAGLKWAGKPLDRILARLAADRRLSVSGTGVKGAEFRVRLNARQRELLDRVRAELEREPVNVPSARDLAQAVRIPMQAVEEIIKVGIQAKEIVSVGEGLYYTEAQIEAVKRRIVELVGKRPFSAAEMRDALATSRRVIIPLLEHLDSIRFTDRVGDNRVVRG